MQFSCDCRLGRISLLQPARAPVDLKALRRRLPKPPLGHAKDLEALSGAIASVRSLKPNEDCVRDGDPLEGCHIVLEGLLCSSKILANGRRPILALSIPGDICGFEASYLSQPGGNLTALAPSRVATIARSRLWSLLPEHPRLAQFMWQDAGVQNAVSRAWLANLGQRNAYDRIVSLFCEMQARFELAGLVTGASFPWPVTHSVLGDMTGLSNVHVQRTLQRLRTERLITFEAGEATLHDLEQLHGLVGFDAGYLRPGVLHPASPSASIIPFPPMSAGVPAAMPA